MAKYSALIRGGTFAGVDQGIDFTGPGTVYALGTGVVERVHHSGSGWPGEGALLTYRITKGPLAGRHIYIAEDFAIADGLEPGKHITQGQPLGKATGSGKAPGIEVGFADASGRAFGSPTGGPQPLGHAFLNAVDALSNGKPPTGEAPVSGGPGGVTDTVTGAVGGAASATTHAVGSAWDWLNKPLIDIGNPFGFLGVLADPNWWLRVLQIVAGSALAFAGVLLLARQVALAGDLPSPPSPVQTAADAVG